MPRLRTVSTRDPGWTRVRHGRGHRYLDVDGSPLGEEEVERVKALVIPPAWRDVWISPHPNAHLQAVGTDEAGRKQYLYHPYWRAEARRGEVRPRDRDGRSAAPGPAAPPAGPEGSRPSSTATRRSRPRCGWSTSASSGSAPTATPSRTAPTASPPSSDATSPATGTARVFCFVGKSGVEHEIRLTDPEVVPAGRQDDLAPASPTPGCWRRARAAGGCPLQRRRHQRAHPRAVRHGGEREGLPHLARDRPRRPPPGCG